MMVTARYSSGWQRKPAGDGMSFLESGRGGPGLALAPEMMRVVKQAVGHYALSHDRNLLPPIARPVTRTASKTRPAKAATVVPSIITAAAIRETQ